MAVLLEAKRIASFVLLPPSFYKLHFSASAAVTAQKALRTPSTAVERCSFKARLARLEFSMIEDEREMFLFSDLLCSFDMSRIHGNVF